MPLYFSVGHHKCNRPTPQHHHGLHLEKVHMPSGRTAHISVPDDLKGWKCGKPTELIDLDPHGRRGKYEHHLVAEELRLTKMNHISGHFRHYHIHKIQKIVNGCFWKNYCRVQDKIKFEQGFINERMLFHGTNKVRELLENGFDVRYASINGMFGAGIYFAKHSSKSNQYAFGLNNPCQHHRDPNCDKCERKMLLCRVTMGKTKEELYPVQYAHPPPGYNSVKGSPGPQLMYPEYIVYDDGQVYPEYLITYKIVK